MIDGKCIQLNSGECHHPILMLQHFQQQSVLALHVIFVSVMVSVVLAHTF